jgi:RCC1 and BTB domain-containing protein
LLDSNTVWCWGKNDRGQLGLGDHLSRTVPEQATVSFKGKKIEQVSCGFAHTLIRTDAAEVLSCGAGDKGQLGLGSKNDAQTFTKIEMQGKQNT